jgi:hypothetical protein
LSQGHVYRHELRAADQLNSAPRAFGSVPSQASVFEQQEINLQLVAGHDIHCRRSLDYVSVWFQKRHNGTVASGA